MTLSCGTPEGVLGRTWEGRDFSPATKRAPTFSIIYLEGTGAAGLKRLCENWINLVYHYESYLL